MTLEQLVNTYKTERYKLSSNPIGTKLSNWIVFPDYLDYFENYLGYYTTINDTEKLIEHAVQGVFEYKSKLYVHPHQAVWKDRGGNDRGVKPEESYAVIDSIMDSFDEFEKVIEAKDFLILYDYIKKHRVTKFGGLEIYDAALRIGSKYGMVPKDVFMHGAALISLKTLETKHLVEEDLSLKKTISIKELPECFKGMKPIHIEDFLSLKKMDIMRVTSL